MSRFSRRIFWSVEDEAFVAVCPELDDLSALGATPAEASAQLDTALDAAVLDACAACAPTPTRGNGPLLCDGRRPAGRSSAYPGRA